MKRNVLLLFGLIAVLGGAASGSQPKESLAQVDPTATHWIPTVPPDLALRYYIGWSAEEVAQHMAARIQAAGEAIGPVEIVAAVDVYPEDAERFGLSYDHLAWGAEPDVALVFSGTFRKRMPTIGLAEAPYYLVIIDRETGASELTILTHDLDDLLDMLPQ